MSSPEFNFAHETVSQLVRNFADNLARHHRPEYNESAARKDYIDKFFIALGWDVNHDTQTNPYEQEVKVERSVSVAARVKKADYAFFLKPNFGQERFFVEAKRPSAILDTPDNCFQTIRYAFSSAKAALSILTNFNELYIIDCRFRPDIETATNHIHKKFRFTDFEDRDKFGEIYYLFGRDAVENGALERYAETLPKPKGKVVQRRLFGDNYQEIDDAFLVQLEVYREELAKMFKRKNTHLDSDSLTEAVQRTIDRLVFIRFLEDKLIEPSTILDKLSDEPHPWKKFIAKSREFDKTYNGIIFKQHPVIDREDFVVDNKVFIDITDNLADKYSPYHFNYIPIHILGSIYERFLGSVIVATAKRATVEQKPEVRKAGGVFYTPQYIVKYIVENTIGSLLSEPPALAGGQKRSDPQRTGPPLTRGVPTGRITPADVAKMRFADIACGSGSFLLGAYEYLLAWHTKYYNERATKTEAKQDGCITNDDGTFALSFEQKKEILVNNIYGVDIDRQAYEVTQLSLFLKLLEDETQGTKQQFLTGHRETMLPSLANNIVCGNALVDWDIEDDAPLFRVGSSTAGVSSPHVSKGSSQPTGALTDVRATDTNATDKLIKLNPMSFQQKFPTIMQNGGFDAIIGNPPWVSLTGRFGNDIVASEVVEYLIQRFNGNTYMPNLYEYFVAKGLNLVKNDGRFSFIVPDRLGFNDQFVKLRKRILDEMWISELIYKVPFPGIVADTLIFVFQKGFGDDKKVTIGEYETDLMTISQAEFWNDEDLKFRYYENRDVMMLTEKIATHRSINLMSEVCSSTSGFGGKSKLISTDQIDVKQIPVLKGDCIGRYVTKGNLWFEFNRVNVTGRTTDVRKLGATPKVLMRKTGAQIIATFDETGMFPEQSLYFFYDNKTKLSWKYLLGLLNTPLMTFYYRSKLITNKDSIAQLKTSDLDKFPIRVIDFNNADEKAMHDLIVRSVEQIMEAKPRLKAAATEREREFWQGKCDTLESDIDQAVYKLYNLTADEIKLVEKG